MRWLNSCEISELISACMQKKQMSTSNEKISFQVIFVQNMHVVLD